MDVSFSCICPVIDNEFVKVVCGSTRISRSGSTATLTMLSRNSWSIKGRTHETGINLLTFACSDLSAMVPHCIYYSCATHWARSMKGIKKSSAKNDSIVHDAASTPFERKCLIYKTGSNWISVISLLESILAMVEQNAQDHTMTITTCRESKVKIYKMSTNFWNNYTPCSLDNVEAFVCGLEGFRLGATFGFRVAIILSSLWQGRPVASSAAEFQ